MVNENKSSENNVHALWYAFANAKEDEDVEFRLEIAESCGGSFLSTFHSFTHSNLIFIKSSSIWDIKIEEIKKKCIWKPCIKRMKYKFQLPCFGKESCHFCKIKFNEKKSDFKFEDLMQNEAAYLLFGDFLGYDRFKII